MTHRPAADSASKNPGVGESGRAAVANPSNCVAVYLGASLGSTFRSPVLGTNVHRQSLQLVLAQPTILDRSEKKWDAWGLGGETFHVGRESVPIFDREFMKSLPLFGSLFHTQSPRDPLESLGVLRRSDPSMLHVAEIRGMHVDRLGKTSQSEASL